MTDSGGASTLVPLALQDVDKAGDAQLGTDATVYLERTFRYRPDSLSTPVGSVLRDPL